MWLTVGAMRHQNPHGVENTSTNENKITKTDKISESAGSLGLLMNKGKSKILKVNVTSTDRIEKHRLSITLAGKTK